VRVVRVERLSTSVKEIPVEDALLRGRSRIALDLKSERGKRTALKLMGRADVVIESHRPGAVERLGLSPDECGKRGPRALYARMTAPHRLPRDPGTVAGEVSSDPRATAIGLASP
jgi:alpha-methylacyl-CoA racemase